MKKWNVTFSGPLYCDSRFRDMKDPCPVYDGKTWHIYGSGGSVLTEIWQILHATAPNCTGTWAEEDPILLHGIHGKSVAVSGMI